MCACVLAKLRICDANTQIDVHGRVGWGEEHAMVGLPPDVQQQRNKCPWAVQLSLAPLCWVDSHKAVPCC